MSHLYCIDCDNMFQSDERVYCPDCGSFAPRYPHLKA